MVIAATSPLSGGVLARFSAGVDVIGFEGVKVDAPVLDGLIGAVPRARGISFTGVGLEPVLEQGGRAPKAGLDPLKNSHGGPGRLAELGRDMAQGQYENRRRFAAEPGQLPGVRAVVREALRMLDAYLNRTDELHPMSTELLARAFSRADEGLPEVGDRVPIPWHREGTSALVALDQGRPAEAARAAGSAQVSTYERRTDTAVRAALSVGAAQIRGTIIDQRL